VQTAVLVGVGILTTAHKQTVVAQTQPQVLATVAFVALGTAVLQQKKATVEIFAIDIANEHNVRTSTRRNGHAVGRLLSAGRRRRWLQAAHGLTLAQTWHEGIS
jgi:phospholipase/lecithinase/hemolysin